MGLAPSSLAVLWPHLNRMVGDLRSRMGLARLCRRQRAGMRRIDPLRRSVGAIFETVAAGDACDRLAVRGRARSLRRQATPRPEPIG